jgi:hypothetical protein
VKVAGILAVGRDGRNVKLVERGGGVAKTFTIFEPAALCDGEDESLAVSVTVNN